MLRLPGWTALLFLGLVVVTPSHAKIVEGVSLAESVDFAGTQLQFNGAGVRSKFFMDLYVAALYLQQPSNKARAIINADETMLLQLHIISGMITSERMKEAVEEGFENATKGNTGPIRQPIDEFIEVFNQPIVDGDTFDIGYHADTGLTVTKNQQLIKRMPISLEFKQALFGIWLSDKPAQKSLKKKLLGG